MFPNSDENKTYLKPPSSNPLILTIDPSTSWDIQVGTKTEETKKNSFCP